MPVRWLHNLKLDTLSGLQLFQLFRYGALLLIAILLPHLFTAEEIGVYEAFLFFAGVITFFWITGLIQGLLPMGAGGRELFNASLLLFLFGLLAGLVLWLIHPFLIQLLRQELSTDLVIWIILYIVLFAPSTLVEYWYVMTNRTRSLLRYGLLAFAFQVLAVALPALIWRDIQYALYGLIIAGGARFTWLIILLWREGDWRVDLSFWKRHLALGMPIAVSVLLSGSAMYVDGFIVSANFDSSVFAIFRYGARELPLVALLAHALSNAMVPVFKRDGWKGGLDQLKVRSARMGTWMFPVTFVLILTSYFIFPFLFGREFTDAAGVFNLYLLLITSRLLFPQTILIALGKTRILMWASLLELLLNVALSLTLVQLWGIRGVALATVIAYYFERLFLVVYLRIVEGIRLSTYTQALPHLIWTIILAAALILTEIFLLPIVNYS